MEQGIILAAGLGSRLKEITKVTPKSLLRVNEQPLLERNIEFMIEAGFKRVILVTGYMSERFQYLKEKYADIDLIILFNEDYASSNTVSSLFRVKDLFDFDSYITTADIYLRVNPFTKYKGNENFYILRPAAYFEKPDWIAELNEEKQFISVDVKGQEGYSYTGCSHWTKEGLQFIKEKLENIDWENKNERNMYWDELLLPYFSNFKLYAKILEDNTEIYEFDDLGDIHMFEKEQGVKVTY